MPTRGESGTRKRRRTPPPAPISENSPRMQPRVRPVDKQATIYAAEQNLRPWEVHPPPAPPRRRTLVQPPTRQPSQDERYKAAVAAPVSPRARQQLAGTMTPERKRQYDRTIAPPASRHDTSLVHAITSTPGSVAHHLGTYLGVAGHVAAAPARSAARTAMETAYGGNQPGLIPPPVRAAVAGAREPLYGAESLALGPDIASLSAGGHPSKLGLAVDVAALLPGTRVAKIGRAAVEAEIAARGLKGAERAAAVEQAFQRVVGGPSLVRQAVRSKQLSGPERDAAHRAIEAMVGDKETARLSKNMVDHHVLKAVEKLPRAERKAAVRDAYRTLRDGFEQIHLPEVGPHPAETVTRVAAHARLKELNKSFDEVAKKISPLVAPEYEGMMSSRSGEITMKRWEQLRRNTEGAKSKQKLKTVNEEIRQRVDDRLHELAAQHPDEQFAHDLFEREQLQTALHGRLPGENAPLPSEPAPIETHVPETPPVEAAATPDPAGVAPGDTRAAFAATDKVMAEIGAHELELGQQFRPDLYEKHPTSGFMVRNTKPQPMVINEYGKPPRIVDTVSNKFGNEVPVEGTERPPKYLFRAVSEEEYQQALDRGYLKSDERMNLGANEGTVASLRDPTWYLPGKLASSPHGEQLGRVLRIEYRDGDGWLLDRDGYVKTQERIPIERVDRAPQFKIVKGDTPSSITGNPIETITTTPTGVDHVTAESPPVEPPSPPEPPAPPSPAGPSPGSEDLLRVVREALPGAKGTYHLQAYARRQEVARRAGLGAQALAGQEGRAGHYAALHELKGELPQLNWGKFKHFDDEAVNALFAHIRGHPHLRFFEQLRTEQALLRAMEGRVPTPGQIKLLETVFGKQQVRSIRDAVPTLQKIKHLGFEIWNVPRSLMASFDLSAPFRQGLMVAVPHPRLFFRNFKSMVRAFGSENVYQSIMEDIATRPTYGLMQRAKLAITDLEDISTREEAFMGGNLAERIPIAGHGVRASGRAYTGFLNKTRADLFDMLISKAQEQGRDVVNDEKLLKSVASFVNSATGRGRAGETLEQHMVTLNSLFFSPRLLLSRLNFMNPLYYAHLDPFARREAVKAAVGLASTLAGILYVARLGGAKVVTDPRNADFAKIRVNNTRIDMAGGFLPPIRLVAQIEQGKIISSTTGKTLALSGGFGGMTREDVAKRFFQTKLAPTPSLIDDWFKGTDFQDKPFSWKKAALTRMIPLVAQDVNDLYQQTGNVPLALAAYGVGGLGVGLQTYGPRPVKKHGTTLPPAGGSLGGGGLGGSLGGSLGGPP